LGSHPGAYFGCSFHAELDAIRKGPRELKGAKMYVYRFSRLDNTLRSSKPCHFCQEEIAQAGISNVIFIDDEENLIKESFRKTNSKKEQNLHLSFGSNLCYNGERHYTHHKF